jgi:integrase
MPTAKLTKSLIDQLPPGEFLWDTALVGLGARRQTKGIFYYVRARVGGKQKMMSLGRHGHLTVEQARRLAQAALGQLATGQDPFATPAAGQARTFSDLASRFLDRQRQRLRPRSFDQVNRHIRQSGVLGPKVVAEITRRDIAECLAAIEDRGGAFARNRVRATLSTFFTFAIAEGLVDTNPVTGTDKAHEASRDRVLSDAELAAIWKALPANQYGDAVRLLLLTGQRREEIGGLRRHEIDLDAGVIRLPASRTKNKRPHEVPLSPAACAILSRIVTGDRATSNDEAVYSRRPARTRRPSGNDKPADEAVFGIGGWSKRKAALDRRLGPGFPPWRLHDCRRTAATGMANLGVAPHIIEACLNHVSGHKSGVAGIYNRARYTDEKRQALERWAAHLAKVVSAPIGLSAEAALQQALPSQSARTGSEATPPTL